MDSSVIQQNRLRWYGHVEKVRMTGLNMLDHKLESSRGRSKKTWREFVDPSPEQGEWRMLLAMVNGIN